ncbi:hypothetical protein [Sphingorhabdus sp. Alg239-R122]|uniref:DUF2306 domain-containing protein n=1 Tax=Sphingorhabdus sp. Alg239-R122 TaxID=2305989 RepID=UPI001F083CC2|nr:hypothetical protein [Sphingorhabdus sp. Alg239-R122]
MGDKMTSKTVAIKSRPKSLKPDLLEKILGALSLILLAAALVSLFKGRSEWHILPWQVWLHLSTILTALITTPFMMWRKRGDKMHRWMGWIWSIAMLVTALVSFDIRMIARGNFSYIHLLSLLTVVVVPLLVLSARRHNVIAHRKHVRGIIIGALLVAGFFTFPFNRIMGQWLFG